MNMNTYHMISKGMQIDMWGAAYPVSVNTYDRNMIVDHTPITLNPGYLAPCDCVLINHNDREAKLICAKVKNIS